MKFSIRLLAIFLFSFSAASLSAQKNFSVTSPGKSISVNILNAAEGSLTYNFTYKGKKVIQPSTLGFSLSSPKLLLNKFTIIAVDSATVDNSWKPVWGEVNIIRNNYKELTVKLKDRSGSGILLNIIFRVFNDGVAFR